MKSTDASKKGVWGFYLMALVFLFLEGAGVHFFTPYIGFWGVLALFIFGGFLLGLWELHTIEVGEEFRDPLMRFGLWLWRENPVLGFVVHSTLTGASMGVGMILKQMDHPRKLEYTFAASVAFAAVWVPLWHYVWT